ncbi:universal stress protein [Lusitaniella coriacea LEGE 07157]|uniref:Universal stress protein n=1 Tax=Lusitaniella coriacea LEGE 07157 TaxID=945747 RepID=A0A8J7DVK7_9CYAN|nr:universal stress protein [Lusitaniella coriacea]MBE9115865.1 universal stress protein [Lusitaniella coriacea LEGE 07157]
MSYQSILVALDGSSQGKIIFEKALELAKKNNAKMMLFHCLPFEQPEMAPYSDLYGQNLANFSRMMQESLVESEKDARQWLEAYRDRAIARNIQTEWTWKIGEAGKCICEIANNWNADLIVVGRRGRQGIAEVFLGSVSNYVIHRASCSVLVVQGITASE